MVRQKIHLWFFFLSFTVISLIEGIHFILDLRFLYFFLFIIPFFLFVLDPKKQYKVSRILLVLIGAYVFFSFISLLNSKQIGISLELFLRDISLFLLTIYTLANAEEIKAALPRVLLALSLIFIGVSVICFSNQYGRDFIAGVRLNLLFNPAYPHKVIGDYLVFIIVLCIYFAFVKKEKSWRNPLFILFPVFLFSFSRTAYATLAFSLLIMIYLQRKQFKKLSPRRFILLIGTIILMAFFGIVFVTKIDNAALSFLQNNFQKSFLFIYTRPLILSHLPFWHMGIRGFFAFPFWGVGQGNFQYLSYRFTEYLFLWSFSSFNVLLDLLAEQGIWVATSFLAFIIFIVIKGKKDSIFYILFLALVFSFMGFSTYTYTQIWMFFFIIAGLALDSKQQKIVIFDKRILILPACIGILYCQIVFLHTILIHVDQRELAYDIYPYDWQNNEVLIERTMDNTQKAAFYLSRYNHDFSTDAYHLEFIGDHYKKLGPMYSYLALQAYEDSFVWGTYAYGDNMTSRLQKLYDLKKQLQGEAEAKKYITLFLQSYQHILDQDPKPIQQNIYNNLLRVFFNK